MTPGIPNKLKAEVRERYAAGEATREELLEAEASSYHAPGTCTFYGTANSNQVLLEAMGVQLPGASFVNPGTPLRDALTHAATERALRITALGADYRPLGRLIDEQAIDRKSELQSLMRISNAVFCLKNKKQQSQ